MGRRGAPPSEAGERGDREWGIAQARVRVMRSVAQGMAEGFSQAEAAGLAGEDSSSVCRWAQRLRGASIELSSLAFADALVAEKAAGILMPHFGNSGQRSSFEHVLEDAEFTQKLLSLYVATMGASGANVLRGRRTAKMATALQTLTDEPEADRYPELKALLRRGKFPAFLCRWLARVTPELESKIRGAKHTQLYSLTGHKDRTIRFPDGSRGEMPAGWCWVLDDMSSNQPFWVHINGELIFSRQGLYAIDQRSRKWLAKTLVSRPREAYRAADILLFLRQLMELYGKPDLLILERGVWHARSIRGYRTPDDEIERPEMSADERAELARGIEAAGVRIQYAHSARGKIIEGAFNYLQDVMACKTMDMVNIGRHAGEFELPAKRMRQARAESHTPEQLGFASADQLSDRIDAAFKFINGRTNSYGEVPGEIWDRDTAKRPLLKLAERDYAAFLPDKEERKIDGGRVVVRGQVFRADWMVDMGSGYRVTVKFDHSNLSRGIALYNAETGSSNTQNLRLGAWMGWGAWEMPGPAADVTGPVRGVEARPATEYYGAGAVDQGDTFLRAQRKRLGESNATIFSAPTRAGQPAIKIARANDGRGNSLEVTRNGAAAPLVDGHTSEDVQRDAEMSRDIRSAGRSMTPGDVEAMGSRPADEPEVDIDEFVAAFAPTQKEHNESNTYSGRD